MTSSVESPVPPDPDDVALVEHEAARAAVDGRADRRVAELELGVVTAASSARTVCSALRMAASSARTVSSALRTSASSAPTVAASDSELVRMPSYCSCAISPRSSRSA